jgi:protein-S-isoprenylcysteine O-methyltransferase Ste14
VRFPPPIVYATAIAGAALLRRVVPLAIGRGTWRPLTAWMLVGLAAVLMAHSVTSFWTRHTTLIPNRPASALVVAGPYRVTRNPMYVAMALLTAGAGLWLNTWWAFALLAPVLLIIDRYVIAREEAYLRRRFGADYEAYARRVRRWI